MKIQSCLSAARVASNSLFVTAATIGGNRSASETVLGMRSTDTGPCRYQLSIYLTHLDLTGEPPQLARKLPNFSRLLAAMAALVLLVTGSGEARASWSAMQANPAAVAIGGVFSSATVYKAGASTFISDIEGGPGGCAPPAEEWQLACCAAIYGGINEGFPDFLSHKVLAGKCLRLPPATGPPTS